MRALAVTLVVLAHAFPSIVPNGFIGVDIFFVISGYLITGILVSQIRDGSFDIARFYVRRANRIFPALIVMLIACIGFGWVSLYANEFELLGRSVAAGAGFVANVDLFFQSGYWDISSKLKPLLHLWSLGVEEQFYLFWPLLLWSVWALRLNLIAACVALGTASLAWNLWSIGTDPAATFYLPFSRLWELLAGGLLATHDPRWRDKWTPLTTGLVSNACAVAGMGLIAIALATPCPPEEFPGWHAIPPVVGTALLIAAGSDAWINSKVLAWRPIVYIGLISFPLYIWHWPLLSFARILENGELQDEARYAAVLLAIALAAGTYHFIEAPIRFANSRRGLTAIVLALLLALCGGAGYSVYRHGGIESRYAEPKSVSPSLPQVAGNSKVALVGDSNAGQFGSGLLPVYHENLIAYAISAWPYLAGTTYRQGIVLRPGWTGTPHETDDALARILSDPSIDAIIIAHMYVLYLIDDTLRSYPYSPPGETSSMAYESGLRRTVKMLAEANKKVIFVKSIPRLRISSVMACSGTRLPIPRKLPDGCETSLDEVRQERREYDAMIARAFAGVPNVSVFDPLPFLCDQRSCYVDRDGVLMYGDPSHLSVPGSKIIGAELSRFVETQRRSREVSLNGQ